MWYDVTDEIFLSEIVPTDKEAYLEHLKEKEIYDGTLRIPYPYTEADFVQWYQAVTEQTRSLGRAVNWAIRTKDAKAIGGVGFDGVTPGESHKGEMGYWLAKPYWGKGIMTAVVKRVCEIGFTELELWRIAATCYEWNTRSARVLEKNGFVLEGTLRNYYLKDGKLIHGKLYAKIYEEA